MKTDKFVFAHKDVTCPVGWEVIDNRKSDLDHRMWSEIAGLKTVYDRYMQIEEEKKKDVKGEKLASFPPDFVCTAHYRRIMDPDCSNRTYITQPIVLNCSVAQHYAVCHFIEDLQLMGRAIKECYPNMVQISEQVLNGNIFIPYNIVNCQYSQFMDYVKFVITVLNKVAEYLGNPTFEEMKEIISKREQPKYEGRNNDIAYQARLYSFEAERLSTIYWLYCARQIPVFPAKVNLLEEGQKI